MTCVQCEAEFDRKPHSRSDTRFCSGRCRSSFHKQRQLDYWHKADGGYIRRRRRHLGEARVRVLQRLAEVTSD